MHCYLFCRYLTLNCVYTDNRLLNIFLEIQLSTSNLLKYTGRNSGLHMYIDHYFANNNITQSSPRQETNFIATQVTLATMAAQANVSKSGKTQKTRQMIGTKLWKTDIPVYLSKQRYRTNMTEPLCWKQHLMLSLFCVSSKLFSFKLYVWCEL